MITCNRCGSANPAEAIQCQVCGIPLSEQGSNTRKNMETGTSIPPELPAWLASLRTQERPLSSPQSGAPSFNAAGLIDDGSLPAWMRPASGDDATPSNAYGAVGNQNSLDGLQSSSIFTPNTDEAPMEGLSANSLVDEKSLPGWLRGQDSSGTTGTPPNNIAASSLVEPNALPAWMQALQPPPSQPLRSMQAPSTPQPQQSVPSGPSLPQMSPSSLSMPPAQGFSARDLVDPQALPSWMTQATNSGPQNTQNVQMPREQAPFAYQQMSPAQPVQPMQPELPAAAGFSASSLIDPNALPPWLRNNNQPNLPNTGGSGATWTSAQSPQPPQSSVRQSGSSWQMSAPTSPTESGSLNASSLMDLNSLPDWLRPAAEQQMAQQNNQGYGRPAASGSGPRPDNVRVPSRPRGEMGPHEGSEVAANVFASMLGVASTAPNFPSGSQGMQSAGQAGAPKQAGQPPMQSGNQASISTSSQMGSNNNNMNIYGANGMMGASGMAGMSQQPQGYMSGAYQPNMPGNGQVRPMPGTNMGISSVSQSMGMAATSSEEAKPAKRGIFEAIRSWLSRS